MYEPTKNDVVLFWSYMLEKFDARALEKSCSWRMKAAAWFLDEMGIIDHEQFMNQFTTTILDTIYTPFDIGIDGDAGYSLWKQMRVCVHECEHVHQYHLNGAETFVAQYLLSKSDRAHYEACAFSADLEMDFWRYGKLKNPEGRANLLRYYSVDDEDIDYAKKFIRIGVKHILAGGRASYPARIAIAWIEKRMKGEKK